MNTITGAYCSAIIYNTTHTPLDPYAIHQIQFLCDHPSFENCKVRIMPDVHPGTLSTIGFTSTLGSTVLPNVIGIDIGCGVTMAQLAGRINEYEKLFDPKTRTALMETIQQVRENAVQITAS